MSLSTADLQGRIAALEAALFRHVYLDGVALPDYASWAAGARLISSLTADSCNVDDKEEHNGDDAARWWSTRKQIPKPLQRPVYAITPELHPGSCWHLKGRKGYLGIRLARPIIITSFTIDHTPRGIAIDQGSAPRSGELWGLLETESLFPHHPSLVVTGFHNFTTNLGIPHVNTNPNGLDLVRLSTFDFDANREIPSQTFPIPPRTLAALIETKFQTVILVILDNWGQDKFTCLCRVRVHSEQLTYS
ncbi:hypothetical protein LXA43DRAFT_899242 [Ganoderma leucocontextum]|nr:hypothetical protein LXA43DRAFT_899242 [Ganoderma leucocontextum]